MDPEACKALNFIESGKDRAFHIAFYDPLGYCLVIEVILSHFYWSEQPMNDGFVRILPYVCT